MKTFLVIRGARKVGPPSVMWGLHQCHGCGIALSIPYSKTNLPAAAWEQALKNCQIFPCSSTYRLVELDAKRSRAYYWQVIGSTLAPTEKQRSQWIMFFVFVRAASVFKWPPFFWLKPSTPQKSYSKKSFELAAYFMVWFSAFQVHFRNWWEKKTFKKERTSVVTVPLISSC